VATATAQSKPAAQPKSGEKKKFDPNTLAPELKPVYQAMQAEFTRKMQELEAKSKQFEQQAAGMRAQLEGAQAIISQLENQLATLRAAGTGAAGAAATEPRVGFAPVNTDAYDPFDPRSVAGLIEDYFKQYHAYIENAWNQLWRSLLELQAYNYQVMRLIAKNPDIDIEKVVSLAPQYGNNLEMAARALYESPEMYKKAQEASKLDAELKAAQAKIKELEAKATPTGVLGGTVGPIPRTVAKGRPPRTYAEVAATEDPASLVLPDVVTAPTAGTPQAGAGAAEQ